MPKHEVQIDNCRLWRITAADGTTEVRVVDLDNSMRWTFRKAKGDSRILTYAVGFGKHDREDWYVWDRDDDLTRTILEQFQLAG